jgi:hypothetical protein
MNYFKLMHIYTNLIDEQERSRVTVEFEHDTLPDVLEEVEKFLLACGYKFDGRLQIVEDDE